MNSWKRFNPLGKPSRGMITRSIFNLRNRHFAVIDIVLLLLTPLIALTLRTPPPYPIEYLHSLLFFTLFSLAVKLIVFNFFQLYNRYWRYASINELLSITIAVVVSTFVETGLFWAYLLVITQERLAFPRSIPLIDGLLTLFAVGGSRFSLRVAEYWEARGNNLGKGHRILIVGAGSAGELIAREALSSRQLSMVPVGFVDDDPRKIGSVIHGLRVLGPIPAIPRVVKEFNVQEAVIAIPTASGSVIRNIVNLCQSVNVPSRTVPSIYEILAGEVDVSHLRKVEIEDLLRRDQVSVDNQNVAEMLAGRRVLVTGAGGSIGSELCRQIISFQPSLLVLLGHGENSLFSQEMQLIRQNSELLTDSKVQIKVLVADVRNINRITAIFQQYQPEIVFHAAAHKHVPLMEENPEEAVTNNILGTRNICECAGTFDVERLVLISTDKAVNPVNIMGMTKRVAEMIVYEAANRYNKPFVSVRFGNVLGSRGSVVPVFQEQIADGGPVTVTHPEMTRFFMTIPEAVNLVLQAAAMGVAGNVFVLDMGEPVKIVDLVRNMIELSGKQAGLDIEIVYTGIRPGEKLYEELFTEEESPQRTSHNKIFVAQGSGWKGSTTLDEIVERLIDDAQKGNTDRTRKHLEELVGLERSIAPTDIIKLSKESDAAD